MSGYGSGYMNKRVDILCFEDGGESQYGRRAGQYIKRARVWAAVDFARGAKAMREGALDAYDTILVRMRWNNIVKRNSRIEYNGRTYMIQSFNEDYQANQIQLTCTELDSKVAE